MSQLPRALERLAFQLGRLPGVGERSALRLAFHLLEAGRQPARDLAHALLALHDEVRFCEQCHHLSGEPRCSICTDPRRDARTIAVVEGTGDLLAIERTGEFHGQYHVLGGVLSPLRGIGPGELHLRSLENRVREQRPDELIIALPVSLEGEATASFLANTLRRDGLRISRIASGVPQGSELEYIDQGTLGRALRTRQPIDA
ncbi:MAG: recombination protein RecR [Pseudomonadota bacterium]|jgi:recombination protein RecR